MSWARSEKLPRQAHTMARILYRYMSYRDAKEQSKNFVYKKDYATFCKDWLGGLTPTSRMGLIKQKQLASRLDPIVETGLLSGYDVTANKKITGFNVQCYPGVAFIDDFGSFYEKLLPLDFTA